MRYRAPEIVLFDLEKNIAAADGMLFGANAPVLIDPGEAITWVASERLSDAIGPLKWRECSPDELGSVFDRQHGRFELAEEIVTSAVIQGRVRCAYVRDEKDNAPVLSYVDPVVFENTVVNHDWDDGLYFQIYENEQADAKEVLIKEFWFFWSEIVSWAPPITLA